MPVTGGGPKPTHKMKVATRDLVNADSSLSFSINRWLQRHGKSVPVKLSDEQQKNLQECFDLMDKEGKGQISAHQMGVVFELMGLQLDEQEVEKLVCSVDVDNSGQLDYEEYVVIMTNFLHTLDSSPQEEAAAADAPHQVPFELMATAYRRKCLLEGLLNRDPDVAQQIARMSEKAAHEAIEKATQAAAASKNSSFRLRAQEQQRVEKEFQRVQQRRLRKMKEGQATLAAMPEAERQITLALLAARREAVEGRVAGAGNQGEEDEASDSPCSTSADPASPPTAAAASDVSPTSTPIDTASTRVTSSEVAPLTDSAVQIAWEYLKPSRKDFTQSTRHRQLMENPQAFGKSHSSGRPASACGSGSASAITRPWSAATTMSRNPMPSRPFSASPNISYTTPARPISASNGSTPRQVYEPSPREGVSSPSTSDQATAASAHATSPPNSARNSDQAANASAHATSPPNSARHSLFAQAQNSVPNSAMNSSFAQAPNSAPNTSRNSSLSQSPNSAMNSSFAQAPSSAPNTSRNSSLSQSPNSDMDSSFSQAHNSAPNTSRNSSSSQVQNSAPNTDRHSSSSFSFTARPLSASPSFSNQTATSRPFSATAPSTSQRSTSLSRQRPMSAMPHSKHASFNFRATHLNQQSQPQPTSRTFTSAMPGFASSSLGARNSGRPVSAYRARGGAGPGADFLMNGAALGSSMHLSPRPQSGKVHK